MFSSLTKRRTLLVLTGATGLGAGTASARDVLTRPQRAARAGVANFVQGQVSVEDAQGIRALSAGTVVLQGQTLRTGADSEVHLVFDDGGYLALRPDSALQITTAHIAATPDDTLAMRLLAGALRSVTGWIGKFDRGNYQLSTSVTTVGIRGTDHELAIIATEQAAPGEIAGIHNWVHSGGTTLRSAGGAIDVDPGHAAWAAHDGSAPRPHVGGMPRFLQRRRTRAEGRVERHAQRIVEQIEARMRKRGMLRPGESLEELRQRHALRKGRRAGDGAFEPEAKYAEPRDLVPREPEPKVLPGKDPLESHPAARSKK